MTEYSVKTIFPTTESTNGSKQTTTKQTDVIDEAETGDVVKLYNQYKNAGYKVNASFVEPPEDNSNNSVSPFDIATNLTKQGIDYKATLKLKTHGTFTEMQKAMKLIEAEGFDMTVGVQLKINDKTSLNIDDTDTWKDEDAVFRVSPKASSKDANDLKQLYTELDDAGYEVAIDIKPKMPKESDVSEGSDPFAMQLDAYPDGSLVNFKLSQADE